MLRIFEKLIRPRITKLNAVQSSQQATQPGIRTVVTGKDKVIYERKHFAEEYGSGWFGRFFTWNRSVTIDLNYDFNNWAVHTSRNRHLRLWYPWKLSSDDSLRRLLFPDLALIGTTSSFLCLYNVFYACPTSEVEMILRPGFDVMMHHAMLTLPLEPFTVCSAMLGLLVTFRTQSGAGRYTEARNLWGACINESRGLATRIVNFVPKTVEDPSSGKLYQREQAVKLVRTFPYALMYHVTIDGCNPEIDTRKTPPEIQNEKHALLERELQNIWDVDKPEELAFLTRLMSSKTSNKPLHVIDELSSMTRSASRPSLPGHLNPEMTAAMDRSLIALQHVLGACERILRTPIYTPYTMHTSRFLTLWCHALPFALYPLVGHAGTVPVSLLISYFMLGIEDIGSRVEEPFHCLPLWQYCQTVDASGKQLVSAHADFD